MKNCWIKKLFSCLRLIIYNHLKSNLLRKRGLLAHTSAAFLKNCCIEKLFRIVQRFSEKYFVVTVPPEQLQNTCLLLRFTRRGGLVRPASKSSRFSHHPLRVPKAWHTDFAACGQRSGLLALNLASIFEKLLDQKTFIFLRLMTGNTALRKALESGSARLEHIPNLPRESQLQFFRFSLRFLFSFIMQFDLLRKCGLLANTSAAFLKNCCTEKLFVCLRLVLQNTPYVIQIIYK